MKSKPPVKGGVVDYEDDFEEISDSEANIIPVVKKPLYNAAPVFRRSAVLVKPVSPVLTKPVSPVVTMPVSPVLTKPVSPVLTNPISPVLTKPVSPVLTKPISPVLTKPVSPVLTKPVSPVLTKPVTGVRREVSSFTETSRLLFQLAPQSLHTQFLLGSGIFSKSKSRGVGSSVGVSRGTQTENLEISSLDVMSQCPPLSFTSAEGDIVTFLARALPQMEWFLSRGVSQRNLEICNGWEARLVCQGWYGCPLIVYHSEGVDCEGRIALSMIAEASIPQTRYYSYEREMCVKCVPQRGFIVAGSACGSLQVWTRGKSWPVFTSSSQSRDAAHCGGIVAIEVIDSKVISLDETGVLSFWRFGEHCLVHESKVSTILFGAFNVQWARHVYVSTNNGIFQVDQYTGATNCVVALEGITSFVISRELFIVGQASGCFIVSKLADLSTCLIDSVEGSIVSMSMIEQNGLLVVSHACAWLLNLCEASDKRVVWQSRTTCHACVADDQVFAISDNATLTTVNYSLSSRPLCFEEEYPIHSSAA